VPGTNQIVTEQIEQRSHNEFYDVFRNGQYVGTYQMSADAEHIHQDGYKLWEYVKQHHQGWTPIGEVPPVDEWNLVNVYVAKLPPEPPGNPSDVPDLNDDPSDNDDQTSDGSVSADLDAQDDGQASAKSPSGLEPGAPPPAPIDVDAIAQALQAVEAPDQVGPDALEEGESSAVQQQAETPTPEQIADSLAQISGEIPQSATQLPQAASPAQDPAQAQGGSDSATPSSDEIAAATEQVIASAPQPAQSAAPIEESGKSDDQDPFREKPPEPSVSAEDNAPSEEVLRFSISSKMTTCRLSDDPFIDHDMGNQKLYGLVENVIRCRSLHLARLEVGRCMRCRTFARRGNLRL